MKIETESCRRRLWRMWQAGTATRVAGAEQVTLQGTPEGARLHTEGQPHGVEAQQPQAADVVDEVCRQSGNMSHSGRPISDAFENAVCGKGHTQS